MAEIDDLVTFLKAKQDSGAIQGVLVQHEPGQMDVSRLLETGCTFTGEVDTQESNLQGGIDAKANTSALDDLSMTVNTLSGNVNGLSGDVDTLTGSVDTLGGNVGTLTTEVGNIRQLTEPERLTGNGINNLRGGTISGLSVGLLAETIDVSASDKSYELPAPNPGANKYQETLLSAVNTGGSDHVLTVFGTPYTVKAGSNSLIDVCVRGADDPDNVLITQALLIAAVLP